MIWKLVLIGLTWQAHRQNNQWFSPGNNYQLSLLIFQKINNFLSHYKAHQQSVPFNPYSAHATSLLILVHLVPSSVSFPDPCIKVIRREL